MKVVITEDAKADLFEIKAFIRPHNPIRAASFIDEILDRCTALSAMPFAFKLIPRYEQHGIRRCVHRDYLIFYRVKEELIEVIRILHGARDFEALLFSDESGQQ